MIEIKVIIDFCNLLRDAFLIAEVFGYRGKVLFKYNKYFFFCSQGERFCCDCGKRRVVYSSKKLSPPEERALCRLQEELLYTCGSPLFPGGEFQDTIVVREGLNCQTPIETTYYAGKKKYIL